PGSGRAARLRGGQAQAGHRAPRRRRQNPQRGRIVLYSMHSFATPAAARALLGGAVDYAGLFPPSGLDMAEAVANYAGYRAGEDAWALGRFVVPVARLGEFSAAAAAHLPDIADGTPWRLSALLGAEPAADAALIARFNDRHRGRALVDAVEARVAGLEEVWRVMTALPSGIDIYLEVPL